MAASEIRRQLEERLEQLSRRTSKVGRDLRTPRDRDWSERAQQTENDEVLDRLDDDGRGEIQEIEAALQRLGEGTYGRCTGCGGEIGEARLRVLPYAGTCMDCA